jgi:hypothetical protein
MHLENLSKFYDPAEKTSSSSHAAVLRGFQGCSHTGVYAAPFEIRAPCLTARFSFSAPGWIVLFPRSDPHRQSNVDSLNNCGEALSTFDRLLFSASSAPCVETIAI